MKKLIILLLITFNCVAQKIELTPLHKTDFMVADEELAVVTEKDTFWISAYIERDNKNIFRFYGFRISVNNSATFNDSILIIQTAYGAIIKAPVIHKDEFNVYFSPEFNTLPILKYQEIASVRFDGKTYTANYFSSVDYFKRLISQYNGQLIAYGMLPDTTVKK